MIDPAAGEGAHPRDAPELTQPHDARPGPGKAPAGPAAAGSGGAVPQPVEPAEDGGDNAVENLMQGLLKGFAAVQLYQPNNRMYVQAVEALRAAFTSLWHELDELVVEVAESTLRWEDAVVLSQEDKTDSIPWTLFKDGVRSLSLRPGVEQREILELLHVIHDARTLAADDPDDLLTLLWERDFQYVRYQAVDLGYDDVPPIQSDAVVSETPAVPPSSREARTRLAQDVGEADETPPGVVRLEDFDSTLYFLDDKEITYLKGEIDREYRQNLRANVLGILFEVFELQSRADVRNEIISIIDGLLPHLLGVGDFQSVTVIVRRLREILNRVKDLSADHQHAIGLIPAKLSNPTALGQLIQSMDDAAVQPTADDVFDFFGELGPHVLDSVLQWLPKLVNVRVQVMLQQVARRIAVDHPENVMRALKSRDDAALLQTIKLVTDLEVEKLAPAFGKLLRHADANIRRAAVDALGAIGSATAMKQLEWSVDDEDRDIRIATVQYCVRHHYPGILPKVEAAINGKLLRGADLSEKKPFFEAYGVFAGNNGVGPLYEMLNGRSVFRRKDDPETRACAAMALGKIGTPEARAALEKARDVKDPLVKNAIGNALREIPS